MLLMKPGSLVLFTFYYFLLFYFLLFLNKGLLFVLSYTIQ